MYESYLKNWLLPAFEGRTLASVTPTQVRALVKAASASLAPNTLWHLHGLLSTIMSSAVADGYITRNPCANTRPPKPTRAQVVPLSVEQVEALVEAINPRCRPMVVLGAGCGLRMGEVLGLRVHRVRFLEREIDVREQVVLAPGHPPRLAPAQNAAEHSNRAAASVRGG